MAGTARYRRAAGAQTQQEGWGFVQAAEGHAFRGVLRRSSGVVRAPRPASAASASAFRQDREQARRYAIQQGTELRRRNSYGPRAERGLARGGAWLLRAVTGSRQTPHHCWPMHRRHWPARSCCALAPRRKTAVHADVRRTQGVGCSCALRHQRAPAWRRKQELDAAAHSAAAGATTTQQVPPFGGRAARPAHLLPAELAVGPQALVVCHLKDAHLGGRGADLCGRPGACAGMAALQAGSQQAARAGGREPHTEPGQGERPSRGRGSGGGAPPHLGRSPAAAGRPDRGS